ncbi:X-linked interleukin-1 receptor accessory protein-like 2 isoform X2 [Gadus chalcogrammus]|uniref:X-linked interleukin-1 receptor accessory protein-like 2 isoform X2 n=1 Tax=Gadus chalcogrammus TaxID=1042646 RepID=UPI0024C4E18D|nr:X-linked interleukin-1 receptor accessory protein-like 2 isoform X2 [Gadus chalcogrammus]
MATLFLALLYFLSFQGLRSAFGDQHTKLTATQGEMLVVKCGCLTRGLPGGTNITWTHHHPSESQRPLLQSREDPDEDALRDPSGHLVVLSASVERQGNYSCSPWNSNATCWYTLTVSPTRQEEVPVTKTCYNGLSCKLKHFCPRDLVIPSLEHNNTKVWQQDKDTQGDSSNGYFEKVAEKDEGVYTCRRSYQYRGRLYNHTSTVMLKVKKTADSIPRIWSPKPGTVYPVQLGSQLVVPCEVEVYNMFDSSYWLDGKSFVKDDQNQSVYSNKTIKVGEKGERKITTSLVFQKVTADQLSRTYTCKVESTKKYSNVSITLALKDVPVSSLRVALLAVLFAMLAVVSSGLVFYWCRVPFTLLLRDKLDCHSNASDGKLYDAYLMTYPSQTETALSEEDRRWMENVLEEQLGYRLCLQDRDVSPGEAVADAVMRCILQSRRVVLLPSAEDQPALCYGLPSAIHSALVDKKSRLLLIRTKTPRKVSVEQPEEGGSRALPESLRLLTKAGSSVTWGGPCSRPLSSSFWKKLRYHLPAPRKLKAMHSAFDSVC